MTQITDNLFFSILLFSGAVGLIFQALIGLAFFISCIWEEEPRATRWSLVQLLAMLTLAGGYLILLSMGFFAGGSGVVVLIGGYLLAIIAGVMLWLPMGRNPAALDGTRGLIVGPVARFDERDHVFARNRSLRPESEEYQTYYRAHPELETIDANRRAKGGPIGKPGTIDAPHADVTVAMALASLNMPHYLSAPEKVKPRPHFTLEEKRKHHKVLLSPEEAALRVKGYAKNLGAVLVGIAPIEEVFVYSQRGEIFNDNWRDWGSKIELRHRFAIVFAEEMSFRLVGAAPHTPTVMESMHNYAKGAYIATQLAAFIANLGYSATANHLRHYELILPPLAVDAGLGEVGRLGYLMTKEFGPRIRLGAVSTDLPLVPDKPVDIGVLDFCRYCKKCARCCPSQSIPLDDEPAACNGSLRWKLDDQGCFDFWGKVGTDCNICMSVCPWSHARTFPHRLIVAMITRNRNARKLFTLMDDLFYGKKPKPKAPPPWAHFGPH